MEYNSSYYLSQPGHPSPPVANHHGGQLMQQQHSPQAPLMMHAPMTPLGGRQGPSHSLPGHHHHQQHHLNHQQQQQQHLVHPQQPMPIHHQSQQQHLNYHHVQQQPLQHGSPVSHSSSPHPQQQQQHLNHNHRNILSTPSPKQNHMHPQSPHHHVGSPMHMQQQQPLNKMARTSNIGHPQSGLQPSLQNHNPNSYSNFAVSGGSMNMQSNFNHYPPQNKQHTIHQQQQHQQQQHHHQQQQQYHSQQQNHLNIQQQQQPSPQLLKHHALSATSSSQVHQGIGRNTPYRSSCILQTEFRIIELNRRLQCRPTTKHPVSPLPNNPFDESAWWERFASEFFEDDATLTIRIQDDKPTDYTIGRTMIPRFFKSYFAGGVTDLSISLRNPKEASIQPQLITLDCDQAFIMTNNVFKHPAASPNQAVVVHTEGHLILDFVSNNVDSLSIKSWKFYTKGCREYIDRSITAIGLPNTILVEPLTFQGLPNSTMIFLKMCAIMKHMQELMSHQKMTSMNPRSCLKKLLFDKYRFKSEEDTKPISVIKRRKRKPPTSPATGNASNAASMKKSKVSAASNLPSGPLAEVSTSPAFNVMVVGEPSSMGSEYRDDNERSISRIENSNYSSPVEPSARKSESPMESEIAKVELKSMENDPIEEVNPNKQEDSKEKKEESSTECSSSRMVDIAIDTDHQNLEQLIGTDKEKFAEHLIEQPIKDDTPSPIQSSPTQPEKYPKTTTSTTSTSTTTESAAAVQTESESTLVQSNATGSFAENLNDAELDEPIEKEKEKENHISLMLNGETQTNSIATQSENHYNIMNSIPEDREDSLRSASCDSISKLPPSSNNKNTLTPNGSSNKQNRRRSSERKETLREGLMRTSDFVVKMEDLKCEHPPLWRITTGNNLLQQFEPKTQNGIVLYENTNQYAGWNPKIKESYVGVDVKLTQHTRNQITVERLLLNFQKIEKPENFYDKHFVIYLQILISTALDPKFWESIENEPKHHDYFITSRRIVEDITKRFKIRLSSKLNLSESFMKNVEKYPNLVVKAIEQDEKDQICRACSTHVSTQVVSFGNRSYDLHSYKPVKVTSEGDDKELQSNLCESCFDLVKLYSEIHHMGWTLYNIAKDKVELHRTFGKPINAILDECLKDEEWLSTIYTERDSLWSKVELIQ